MHVALEREADQKLQKDTLPQAKVEAELRPI